MQPKLPASRASALSSQTGAAEVDEGLVELIKQAFTIRNQLLSASDDSIEAMSARLGMNKGRRAQDGRTLVLWGVSAPPSLS
jgi:hypothetical protein